MSTRTDGPGSVIVRLTITVVPPARVPGVHAPGRADLHRGSAVRAIRAARAVRAVEPQADRGRIGPRRGEQHRVAVHAEDLADLQAGRGDRGGGSLGQLVRRADQQPPGPAGVGGPGDPAAAGPGGHPGHDVHPPRVGVLAQHGRGAGRGVRGQQPHHPLVAALHHDQRVAAGLPGHRDQVGERGAAGVHLHPASVQAGQQQRDVGVGGAGRGIGDGGGRPLRVGRVGDVPPLDRVLVHPGHQQAGPVRRPPVPAHPAHLLGRDELGQAVGDAPGTCRVGQHGVLAAAVCVDPGHVQRAVVDVRDPRAGRVGPGIQRGRTGTEQAGTVRPVTVALLRRRIPGRSRTPGRPG